MEKLTGINTERLLWCCRESGIDIQQVASEAGITESTLGELLQGTGGLSFAQLQRVSKIFNRGVLFFLEDGKPNAENVFSPQFRTLANQKPQLTPKVKAIIQRAERQREIFISLRDEIGIPVTGVEDLPELPNDNPGLAGEIIRSWLGLGSRNDFSSYRRAVEAKGILVFRTNGYGGAWQIPKTDEVDGFCLYDERCPVIVVRKHLAEARQVFTLFHELGHLVLHKRSYIDNYEDFENHSGSEQDANDFAGRLLVPKSLLDSLMLRGLPAEPKELELWLQPLKQSLGISAEVLLRRLLDTGALSQTTYEEYREWKAQQTYPSKAGGNRAFRHREPIHIFGEPFARTVLEAMAQKRITPSKASKYLDNVKLRDLRSLEAYIAAI